MPPKTFDAILFDLDDTLHDDTLAFENAALDVAREVAAERSVDSLALKSAYIAEAHGFWKRLTTEALASKLSNIRETMWEKALASVGVSDRELASRCGVNYNAYRSRYLQLFPGALDLLHELRRRGKKLGLITNGFSETHREKIALLRIGELFDAIFIADEVGMVKPDPLLFAHACRQLDAAPAVSVMVGDRYDRDIKGAHDAGLFTIWINLFDAKVPIGSPAPGATVRSLEEVGALIL